MTNETEILERFTDPETGEVQISKMIARCEIMVSMIANYSEAYGYLNKALTITLEHVDELPEEPVLLMEKSNKLLELIAKQALANYEKVKR